MAALYRHFGGQMGERLEFDDNALLSLYNHESYGTALSERNGYAVGKRYLNLQVTAWKEMLREGTLAKFELYEDPSYPHWWLDSVLENTYRGLTYAELLSMSKVGGSSRVK